MIPFLTQASYNGGIGLRSERINSPAVLQSSEFHELPIQLSPFTRLLSFALTDPIELLHSLT